MTKLYKIASSYKSILWKSLPTGIFSSHPGFCFKKGLSFKRLREDIGRGLGHREPTPQFLSYIFWHHLRQKPMDINKNYARQARRWFKSKC